MTSSFPGWSEWRGRLEESFRDDRFPLMCLIRFETSALTRRTATGNLRDYLQDRGLTVNVSHRGLCMLAHAKLEAGEVVRLQVPCMEPRAKLPTLAEVRWVQHLPQAVFEGYAVGLRFVL